MVDIAKLRKIFHHSITFEMVYVAQSLELLDPIPTAAALPRESHRWECKPCQPEFLTATGLRSGMLRE